MSSLKSWVSAMRLRTLPLSVSGIIVGSAYAYDLGYFNGLIFSLAIICTIAFQILSNLANDYGDTQNGADNKDRVGPKRAVQSGAISAKQMLLAIKINIAIALIAAVTLIVLAFGKDNLLYVFIFLALAISCIYAAIKYTMGDKPYGYRAMGDVFVFIFFGVVSVFGSFMLYTNTINTLVIIPAIIIGLLSVGVLNLNNMRDVQSDKKANKVTLVVKLGLKNAKIYHYLIIGIAIVLILAQSLISVEFNLKNLLPILVSAVLLKHLVFIIKSESSARFDSQLKPLALTTFLYALLTFISVIL